jgi:hypothetical protein
MDCRDECTRFHKGTDVMAVKLQPLVSPVDGVVVRFMDHPTAGRGIVIQGVDGYQYRLYHLNNDNPGTDDGRAGPQWSFGDGLTVGTRVSAGELVGFVGDSGNAEGYLAHVHVEIHRPDGMPINPYWSLQAAKRDELHCAPEAAIDDSWLHVVGVAISPAGFRPADTSLCLPEPEDEAPVALAAIVGQGQASVPLSGVATTTQVILDQFDPADGTLERATITVDVAADASVNVTNLTPEAKSTTVVLGAAASVAGPGVGGLAGSAGDSGSGTIGAGASASFALSGSGGDQLVITDPAVLAQFVGTGTVTFDVTGAATVDVQGPATWRGTGSVAGTATVSVTYNETTTPPSTTQPPGPTTTTAPPNDPPAAVDDGPFTVDEDAAATAIDVLINDSDAEGDPFTIATVSDPSNGTAVIDPDGLGLTYQPDADYCNTQTGGTPDTFTYALTPGGDTATVTVIVTCAPDGPQAEDDAATVAEDEPDPVVGNVLTNDVDVDGDVLTVAAVNGDAANVAVTVAGSYGDLVIDADGTFSYAVSTTYRKPKMMPPTSSRTGSRLRTATCCSTTATSMPAMC